MTSDERQYNAWQAWRAAEEKAARTWADPQSSAQECAAACWERECAEYQWANAVADHKAVA